MDMTMIWSICMGMSMVQLNQRQATPTVQQVIVILIIIAVLVLLNTYPALFWIGIGMIAVSAVFSLITLPVEYNASARAMEWLTGSYTLKGEQAAQAKEALAWAARTYLVAALSAVVTLIYYIGIARRQ